MAGMMDEMEGMAECVWWIVGDGFVRIVGVVVFGLEAFDDDDDRSCNSGKSMIFIFPPTVDEHLDAAPSADYSNLARDV